MPKVKIEESPGEKPSGQKQNDDDEDEGQRNVYLGLNVNGKKRKDLARKEDPDAFTEFRSDTNEGAAIGWRAAANGATAIIEYLSSPKAFEAYKFYSENSSGNLAKRLAEALQNPNDFPAMVGFSATRLSETPVLAAVWNTPIWNPLHANFVLPTLKKLMDLQPKLTTKGLRSQVEPNRMSAFLVLCTTKLPLEVFDWMLANGADPMVRDERGYALHRRKLYATVSDNSIYYSWNIFHLIFLAAAESDLRCTTPDDPQLYFITHRTKFHTNWDLIEHALAKLPIGTIKTLMTQQSRTLRNTVSMVADRIA